ncbi:cell division protein FtsZ [Alloprevotella sp. oral taxon 473]|uniref:cell division protein FtsZ n=1 Tax=Alloprevotella sp. oral taxon 473 TaxID=712469 RepID=UPI0002A4654D|nr:cell division protein FtsZ [Alloprevotella sp. oral taxon 473]EKX91154.1 cell division protein FtsZ [Alloprevotella sp. oral taxon 473 str. F0040]
MSEHFSSSSLEIELPPTAPALPANIKVIGVGGGGGNAVANMYREGIEGVHFIVCNTDSKALEDSPIAHQVQLGPGLGAGGRPEKGAELAEKHVNEIIKALGTDTNMLFITAGMGGGTGTGAAPIIAREAMKLGILTVGIVTIPFKFEMPKQIDKALDGVTRIAKEVDTLLVINNQRLLEIYSDFSMLNAFRKADQTLTNAVNSIVEVIKMRGREGLFGMNLDFQDIDTCLRGGGAAIMSSGVGKGEHRLREAIQSALNSPLLNDTDVQKSQSLRLAIFSPPEGTGHALMVEELNEVDDFMKGFETNPDFKHGFVEDPRLTEEIKVIIIASGFHKKPAAEEETPQSREQEKIRDERRGRYYDPNNEKTRRRPRIYIFADDELDNEELTLQLEARPTVRRTDSDLAQLHEIGGSRNPIEILADETE